MFKRYPLLILLFAGCFSLICWRASHVSVFEAERARNTIFGDGFSDINTISSARYFADSGFTQTAFLPVHDYKVKENAFPVVYTHYPALPNILAGFYAVLFQSESEWTLRIIPVLLSVFFFFMIFRILAEVTGDDKKALAGSIVLWVSNYFLVWADNLHQHLYGEMLKWLYFLLLYRYHKQGRTNRTYFWLLMLLLVVQVNITFEQPVFLGVLTLGFAIVYQRRIFTMETIGGVIAIVAGFGLHLLQNVIYLGSLDLALEDLKGAFLLRTAGVETQNIQSESAFGLRNIWEIPFNWFNRMERFYALPGWGLLLMSIWGYRQMRTDKPELVKICIALFFASAAWSVLMAQHAFIHTFTNKHFSIWYAITAAYALPAFIAKIKQDLSARHYVWISFDMILIAYCAAMFATQQVWEVYIRYGFGFPYFGK